MKRAGTLLLLGLVGFFAGLCAIPSRSWAFSIEERWSIPGYRKTVEVSCDPDHGFVCAHLCNNTETCSIAEDYCRDCAGTSQLVLLDFFKNLGRTYRASSERQDVDLLIQTIRRGRFMTFSSKSPWNFWSAYDSAETRAKFMSLCSDPVTDVPLVFFETDAYRRPVSVKFVACFGPKDLALYGVRRQFDSERTLRMTLP
ncbi:MAG: hypothetical protein RJB38_1044 [Pseudomonadota bacterium]|jgi:hypothetical protein